MTTTPNYDKLIETLKTIKKLDKGSKDNTKEIYMAQTEFKKLVTQEFKFSPQKYYKCKVVTQRERIMCDICNCEVICLKSHNKTSKHQKKAKSTIDSVLDYDSSDTVIKNICEDEELERKEIEKISEIEIEKISEIEAKTVPEVEIEEIPEIKPKKNLKKKKV